MLESSNESKNPKRKRVSKGTLEPGMKIIKERPEFWMDPRIIDETRKKFASKQDQDHE